MSKSVFDREAERYDRWFVRHDAVYQSEVAALRCALPAEIGRGLEIGTGTGRFSIPFGIIEGVEPSAAMRQIAESRGIAVTNGVGESLPFADRTFDVALMVTTICFVRDPDRCCSEAWRVVRSKGYFVIGLVDSESTLGRHYQSHRQASPFYRTARFFSVPDVVALMRRAGFRRFHYWQTLINPIDEIIVPDPVLPDYGQGGFVVIQAKKTQGDRPAREMIR